MIARQKKTYLIYLFCIRWTEDDFIPDLLLIRDQKTLHSLTLEDAVSASIGQQGPLQSMER